MSIVQKIFSKADVELGDTNHLPPGQRTQKIFRKIIKAAREVESETVDHELELLEAKGEAEKQRNEALKENGDLRDEIRRLEGELLKHRLSNRMDEIAALKPADKAKLLELAH